VSGNHLAHVASLLDRNLGNTGQRPSPFTQDGDIADGEMVDHLAGQVDAIVNFAAETHVDRSLLDPFAFVITDVLGTGVLAEAARKHSHEVFLLVSTDEVYGSLGEADPAFSETTPYAPNSPYSASKAALNQLARVAALEWAKDGIRINSLHPNAVYDTALWTDEVLASRAKAYHLTVEQYRKNNLLQQEVSSRDVAELAAEMCGPLFAKTTAAQVPVDGGNERVV